MKKLNIFPRFLFLQFLFSSSEVFSEAPGVFTKPDCFFNKDGEIYCKTQNTPELSLDKKVKEEEREEQEPEEEEEEQEEQARRAEEEAEQARRAEEEARRAEEEAEQARRAEEEAARRAEEEAARRAEEEARRAEEEAEQARRAEEEARRAAEEAARRAEEEAARRAEEEARRAEEEAARRAEEEAARRAEEAAQRESSARMLRVKRRLEYDDKFDISPLKQAVDETGDFYSLKDMKKRDAKTRLSESNVVLSRQQKTGRQNKFHFHPGFKGNKLSIIRKISNSLIKNNPESENDLPTNNAGPIENDVFVPADKNKQIFHVRRDHKNPFEITSIGMHDQKISFAKKVSLIFKEKVEERSLPSNEYTDIFKEALKEIRKVQEAVMRSHPQEETDGVEAEKVGQARRAEEESEEEESASEESEEESEEEESASEGSGEGEPEEDLEWDTSFDSNPIIRAQSESNIEIESPLFSSQESESDEGSGADLEISDASSETEPDTDYSMSSDAESALLRPIQENLGIPYDINDGGITQLQDDQTDATTGVELENIVVTRT